MFELSFYLENEFPEPNEFCFKPRSLSITSHGVLELADLKDSFSPPTTFGDTDLCLVVPVFLLLSLLLL